MTVSKTLLTRYLLIVAITNIKTKFEDLDKNGYFTIYYYFLYYLKNMTYNNNDSNHDIYNKKIDKDERKNKIITKMHFYSQEIIWRLSNFKKTG
jgi:hypothetical protein